MAPSRLSAIEKFGFFVSVATLLSCSATAFGQDKGSPSKPRRATLQQQKMCDEQAKKKFHEDNPHPNETTGYTSHYDPQVNVCYILVHYVEASKNGVSVSDDVYDAFEGREYAAYIWINNEGKKFWEIKPMECWIKPLGGEKQTCNDSDEFDSMVEKNFGIGK